MATGHRIYTIVRNGAAYASVDTIETARARLHRKALWDTALGPDPVHPGQPNNIEYRIETHAWDIDARKYTRIGAETVAVDRDRARARAELRLGA